MKAVVIGCGRVGSAVALQLAANGWDVTAVDEDEEALGRLGKNWKGGFVVGHAMETEVIQLAGIETADAAVVATSGDNTNLVLAQVIQKRYDLKCVVVRVLDPRRAEFFARLGLRTISPTQTAISTLVEAVRACETPVPTPVVEVEA
jgi:trk system potassium uptake protein TrkA